MRRAALNRRLGAATMASLLSMCVQTGAAAVWEPVDEASIAAARMQPRVAPGRYRTFRLSPGELAAVLDRAPREFTARRNEQPALEIPMPDGSVQRFAIEESPVVEQGLLDKYPELRTYRGQGLDDAAATARVDWLPSGFHAIVLAPSGTVLVDPYAAGDGGHYVAYRKRDAIRDGDAFVCATPDARDPFNLVPKAAESADATAAMSLTSGQSLRTYRLALGATNEYAVAVGANTIAGTLAAEVLIMNRINGVYERDLAIHMNIVANNDLITYAGDNLHCGGIACTAANDPYTNSDGSTMLAENQATLDSVIGTANYDIGHVFSTGGGGIAYLNAPCSPTTKARGVTGLPNPVGDAFAIDYVAHEMGHQFGANHTFNGADGSCFGNGSPATAYEPGSGITIMGYAGICDAQDLAAHSIDTFHVRSLEEIVAFGQGDGNACAAQGATGNTPPILANPGNFAIPRNTPFVLTASATDANGDSITYDWEEYDLDQGFVGTSAVPNTDSDGTPRPIFRPYPPTSNGTRFFPSLQYVLNNGNVPPAADSDGFLVGELLPAIGRTMTFKVIARDNRAGAGGINTAISTITVDGGSGPFAVTAPNAGITVTPLSAFTVTWNVANTAGSPVNATNVRISMSTDGGQTFPIVLAASVPNTGSRVVAMPNVQTTTARIKVEAVGNIFFDVSDANFTIVGTPPVATLDLDASDATTRYDALTDGVLLLRYLNGVTGGALTAGALGATATRTDPATLKTFLDARLGWFDIDGNGIIDPATDGELVMRYLLGFRNSALTAGAVAPGATRSMPNAIQSYLQGLMP